MQPRRRASSPTIPWMGTGHLFDFTVVTPVFRTGTLVGFFACDLPRQSTSAASASSADGTLGLRGRPLHAAHAAERAPGKSNETLLEHREGQRARARSQVRGDLLVAASPATRSATRRLARDAATSSASRTSTRSAHTSSSARARAMRAAIARGCRAAPGATRMTLDGYEPPDRAAGRAHDRRAATSTSTSPAPRRRQRLRHQRRLNCYTDAYTSFGVKCIVAPERAQQRRLARAASRRRARRLRSCNAQRPRAGDRAPRRRPDAARPRASAASQQALPGRVPAEGASCTWTVQLRRGPDQAGPGAPPFDTLFFNCGGSGARPARDGLSATAFPSGVKAMPVEVVEHGAPIVIWRKELRPDSGGRGEFRGGLGLSIEVGSRHRAPMSLLAMFERVDNVPQGRAGGAPGAPGRVALRSGARLRSKGTQPVPAGETLILETPGGGGYGDPANRAAERAGEDLRLGLTGAPPRRGG